MARQNDLERRLADVRLDAVRLREELRVLDEQVSYQGEVAEEAATRAVVASTPLADRERRSAEDDAARTRRQRDEVATRLHDLEAEQDDLLERVFARVNGTGP